MGRVAALNRDMEEIKTVFKQTGTKDINAAYCAVVPICLEHIANVSFDI